MRNFTPLKVSDWAKVTAAVVAVGALLAVQVASADRAQSSPPERQQSATTVATYPIQSLMQSSTADMAALAGARFYAISPYRSYDSRFDPAGPIKAGSFTEVDLRLEEQNQAQQRVPSGAVAVTYNLTVTATKGAGGYLALFPAGQPWPGNSSINWWTSGLDLANGGVVALGTARGGKTPECPASGPGCVEIDISPIPGTATDFIIDVTGYYAA